MILVLTVALTLISILGLVLNVCILIAVLLTKQLTSANNLLLFHLGIIDVLLGVLFLAFPTPGLLVEDSEEEVGWGTYGIPCILHGFLHTLLHPLALWTVCGLNCERYYAISAPLHYGHIVSPRRICVGLALGWAVSIALCVPPLVTVAPYTYIPGLGACAPDFTASQGTLWYSSLYTAFTLLLPATLIVCCNCKILMIARYHRHRIASAIFEVTLSAQVTITHQRNPFAPLHPLQPPKVQARSALDTVARLLAALLLLYLPRYLTALWEAGGGAAGAVTAREHLQRAAGALLACAPAVNGWLYGGRSKVLRKSVRNWIRKKQTKSEIIQEIQARTPSTCGSRRPSLTPLGFLTKPLLQRRLSEALLDVSKSVTSPNQRPKIKRIASELAWRPASTNSINLSPKDERRNTIKHTASCNTLKVPTDADTQDDDYINIKPKSSPPKNLSTNLILNKFFSLESPERVKKPSDATPQRSPKIMITRAFSEESDKSSSTNSPSKEFITKKHSSSATTLLEKKWKLLRNRDEDEDRFQHHTSKPLLDSSSTRSLHSSESSDNSDISLGTTFHACENRSLLPEAEAEANEDQLLLSWPTHKKYNKNDDIRRQRQNLLKQTLANIQSHEIVL